MANDKLKAFGTPFGIASYPCLHEPDTKGEYPTGKYNGNIILTDPKDIKDFKATIAKIMDRHTFKTKKVNGSKDKYEDPNIPYKYNKDEQFVIVARSKFQPTLFDSKNNKLPEGTIVGGGSVMRMMVEPFLYDAGLSLQIRTVQIKELKEYSRTSGFDEVDDGYEADTFENSAGTSSDDGDDDNDL